MSRDHTSPNPFLDSTYGHGYPVQFPLQGDARPFRQTGHATDRNNYGAVAQLPDLASSPSPAPFPSATPFQSFYPAVFARATRDADSVEEMFSSSSETCRPEAGSSSQSEENGAKPSQSKWSDTQASVLVEEWKERVEEVEQKQPSPSSSHSHASSYATQPVQHEKNKQQSQMYIHRDTLHTCTNWRGN